MPNYRMTVCYDGTRFNGWQRQGNTKNTLQEQFETLLALLASEPVDVNASGRTDAGVHARHQVCSFRMKKDIRPDQICSELRAKLPEDVGVLSVEYAEPRFHARLNCKSKTYVYTVHYSEGPDVFQRRFHYLARGKYELSKMREAASLLLGTHDFTSFTSNKHMKKSAVRCIHGITIVEQDGNLVFTFTGDGFLYHMVRILVGTLLEVGTGKLSPQDIPGILAAKDRALAGYTVPAQGLILWDVQY